MIHWVKSQIKYWLKLFKTIITKLPPHSKYQLKLLLQIYSPKFNDLILFTISLVLSFILMSFDSSFHFLAAKYLHELSPYFHGSVNFRLRFNIFYILEPLFIQHAGDNLQYLNHFYLLLLWQLVLTSKLTYWSPLAKRKERKRGSAHDKHWVIELDQIDLENEAA